MKLLVSRMLAGTALALIAWLLLVGANAPRRSVLQPDKVIILSTTDVKGKTSPCG